MDITNKQEQLKNRDDWNKEFKINTTTVFKELKLIKRQMAGLIHNQSRQRGDEVVD